MENQGSGILGEVVEDPIDFNSLSNKCGMFPETRNICLPPLPFTLHFFFHKTYLASEEEGAFWEQWLVRKEAQKRTLHSACEVVVVVSGACGAAQAALLLGMPSSVLVLNLFHIQNAKCRIIKVDP